MDWPYIAGINGDTGGHIAPGGGSRLLKDRCHLNGDGLDTVAGDAQDHWDFRRMYLALEGEGYGIYEYKNAGFYGAYVYVHSWNVYDYRVGTAENDILMFSTRFDF